MKLISRKVILRVSAALVLTGFLNGCFTGVESTPKITQKELKKQNIVDIPESHILDGITAERPASWAPGKRFYVADNRVSRVAWRVDPVAAADSLQGRMLVLTAIDTVPTLTDHSEIQVSMAADDGGAVVEFRTGLTPEQWSKIDSYAIPHLIDMQMISRVRDKLVGGRYYVLPARRIGSSGVDTVGTRYQSVVITDILPAAESTPVRTVFVDSEGNTASLLMTLGDSPSSRRNFETLFTATDPRTRYKNISPENWQKIIHSRVALGMTPDECRLALGSPDNYTRFPTTAGMVERWTYSGGVYLVFEDGLLSAFRQ